MQRLYNICMADRREITLPEPDDNGIYTLDDGRHVRQLRNGTLYDVDTKRFVSGPDAKHLIQPGEHAVEMAKKKSVVMRQRAREGTVLAALKADMDVKDEGDAWMHIVASRAAVALLNAGRDGTDAARFVGKAGGFMEEEGSGGEVGKKVGIDVSTLMELARAIDSEVKVRTAKAQAIEGKVME